MAVEYMYQQMLAMDLDSVWLQPVMVKSWDRGEPERGWMVSEKFGTHEFPVTALGWSVATGNPGLSAGLVEVRSLDELKSKAREVPGKVVLFNQPMDRLLIETFRAYGGAAWQRTNGPAEAARLGAVGCIIRSLSIEIDDTPHTGITQYVDGVKKIPAIAISTRGADQLSQYLAEDPELNFFFRTTCKEGPEVQSYNVIGEIRGTLFPEEIITVGGHLDAWDTGEGAHDDGGGCIQSVEVLRIFRKIGIDPRHTIRAVMFMDEEVAQRGGLAYAAQAAAKGEKHIAALESDRGVFRPMALGVIGNENQMEKFREWQVFFNPYRIDLIKGGGGVDIGPLLTHYPDILMMGLIPDDQQYFTLHHSADDKFSRVDRREMQLGSAGIASLIYLFDLYGL